MANKTINGRIVHKHDTETNWEKAINFIPMAGELIIYDVDDTYDYERIKIGDGVQNVNDLPFISEQFPVRTLSWLAEKYPELVVVSEGTNTRRYSFYFHYDEAKRIPRGLYVNDYQNDDNKSFAYTLYAQNASVLSVNSTTSYVGIFTKTHSSGSVFYGFYTDTRYAGININSDGTYTLSDKIQVYRDEVLHLANTTAYAPTSDYHPATKKYVDDSIVTVSALVGDTSVSEQITTAVSTKADADHTHDDRYYTETEIDSKLSGKSDTSHTHSAYVNQNAFSNIKVGNTTVAADTTTDTVTLVAGNNVTLTPDATNDKITIAATDTVYTHPSSGVTAGTYKSVTVNAQGHVTAGSNPTTLSGYGITDAAAKSHSHNNATTSAAGFMSATDKSTLDSLSGLVGDTSVSAQIAEAIADKVDKVSGKQLSTNDYTTTEKNKLANIASGAEVNQNAFSNIAVGTTTIAADAKTDTLTIAAGSNVTITPDATNDKITIAAKDTVYTHPTYTSKSSGLYKIAVDGTGHVSGTTAVAKSDITALGIPAQDTTYSAATTSTAGLMSASDKSKLDGIATGANKTTVDSSLSSTSTNPVQNKVVNAAISNLNTLVGDTSVASQISTAIADKADADHTHTAADVGADASGAAASALSNAKSYTDTKISNLINGAPTTLDTLGEIAAAMEDNADVVEALETAVGTKANASDLTSHTGNKSNPHGVTVSQIGAVPTSRTVNGKALSANITLAASDVGADASGAASSALTSAKAYTDSEIAEWVGDTIVSKQISTAVAAKADASHTHSTYVNQNAFSNVIVGSTTVAADSATDTLTLVAGNNVTITPDATNDKITIAAKNTVYTHPSYTARTGVPTANQTPAFGGTFTVSQPVSDSTGHITAVNSRTVTIPSTAATTSVAGLMSSSDKTKLDGIATGANKTTVDSALSTTSTNPVQNKIVTASINNLNTLVGDTAVSEQIADAVDDCITGLSVSGKVVTYTKGDGSTGTITTQDTNTTYSAATTSTAGLMSASDKSKLDGITASADAISFSRSLTSGTKVGTITINGTGTDLYAPTNTDTHYTSKNVVGSSTATSNTTSALTNGNVYLNSVENGVVTSAHKISGSGATTVTTDTSGNIVVSSNNTTYSAATTSAAGLMSASDKATLSNLSTLVGDTSVASQISTATASKVDTVTTTGSGNAITAISKSGTTITATKGSTFLTAHPTILKSTDSTSTASPAHGGTFTAVDSITRDSNGHVTKVNTKTITLPADNNTDTKVTQTVTTSNASYPLLLAPSGQTSTATTTSYFDSGVTLNPSTNTIVANISGNAATATKATSDGSGNNIVNTYATKTALNSVSALVGDTAVSTQISNAVASKADTSHTHNYAGSSSAGGAATSANKVNTNLTIKLNGGTTEGTNLFTFNGSAAKTVNITPSAIGAAASSHGTHVSYGTSAAALGTSSAGSATTVSRSDHVHALPALTSCTGTLTVAKGGTGASTAAGALTNLGLTATATELNYCDGVTSNIQTQLNAKASSSHTHSYAASSSAGGAAKVSESDKGITTAGTGAAYTATVSGITALSAGVSFIMIPHTVSTTTAPTLNVNSLGAKTIKRRLSNLGTGVQAGYTASWLASGIPFRVTYDGTQWVVSGMEQPAAADLYGTLAISKGGTGATDAATACANLGIVNLIYPVGSIYMSVNSTSPSTLFGGTWTQIQDTFLLAAGSSYTAGTTGGESTHTLTISEIPAHTHNSVSLTGCFISRALDGASSVNKFLTADGVFSRSNDKEHNYTGFKYLTGGTEKSGQINRIDIDATHEHDSVGGSSAHNNMPPYLAVYVWKRVS